MPRDFHHSHLDAIAGPASMGVVSRRTTGSEGAEMCFVVVVAVDRDSQIAGLVSVWQLAIDFAVRGGYLSQVRVSFGLRQPAVDCGRGSSDDFKLALICCASVVCCQQKKTGRSLSSGLAGRGRL